MPKSHFELATPNETVTPTRRPDAEVRTPRHLTPDEVKVLVEAAKANRHGVRDATMILIAFRHGLRAAEVCDLRWDQVDFDAAALHVRRVKNGTPSTHPLLGDEMRALRRLQRESDTSPFVFVSERGSPFTTAGFARIVERAAAAHLELKAHPHMLREACGYALAKRGYNTRDIQVWLGHRFRRSRRVKRYLPPLADPAATRNSPSPAGSRVG
jgi:type 1 fimbriae regulatory protein FimB/type 1 fimbriae regulatory protein FimE